jgi:hypothetical protein
LKLDVILIPGWDEETCVDLVGEDVKSAGLEDRERPNDPPDFLGVHHCFDDQFEESTED